MFMSLFIFNTHFSLLLELLDWCSPPLVLPLVLALVPALALTLALNQDASTVKQSTGPLARLRN